MTDDIEGEVQQSGDAAPPSEPAAEPGEIVSSDDIRRAVEIQRERGPDGKFVKSGEARQDEPRAAKGIATASTPRGVPKEAAAAPKPETGARPPAGFSVTSKQAWESLPEQVKADIVKREAEIEAGAKRYSGLASFAEEAERNGTTLQNAVADYSAVETEVRRDPVAGIEFMFRKLGACRPQPMGQALFGVAARARRRPTGGPSGATGADRSECDRRAGDAGGPLRIPNAGNQ
jgi:hypothetical protein